MDKRNMEIILHSIIIITILIISVIIPFKNPDMTQTRLLIEYWWFYLPSLILMLISSLRLHIMD